MSEATKIAAARAIAAVIPADELSSNYIIPSVFNRAVAHDVAEAAAAAAIASGVARRTRDWHLHESTSHLEVTG
jgi:malate dehydrogenase (oxaloacetate-decarboxylating)